MFNFFTPKITNKDQKDVQKDIITDQPQDQTTPESKENTQNDLTKKLDNLSGFIHKSFAYFIVEYRIIKEKLKDLSRTNYDLGMKHLEEGNIKEAIFRFKITKKFWKDNYDAYYQLIYCLILDNKFEAAQKVIDELLQRNPGSKTKIDQLFSGTQEQDLSSVTKNTPDDASNNQDNNS